MKSFQKGKSGPNAAGPGFRTSKSFLKSKVFGQRKNVQMKFNPAQFKTQHKG